MILDSPCEKGDGKGEFPELSEYDPRLFGVPLLLMEMSDSVNTLDLSAR